MQPQPHIHSGSVLLCIKLLNINLLLRFVKGGYHLRPKCRWEGNIKMYLGEIGWEVTD